MKKAFANIFETYVKDSELIRKFFKKDLRKLGYCAVLSNLCLGLPLVELCRSSVNIKMFQRL